ncbi:MAG: hypothetical protein ACXVHT_12785 [Methanobacterium sp.]
MQKNLLYGGIIALIVALAITFLIPYIKTLRDILVLIGLVLVILGLTQNQ